MVVLLKWEVILLDYIIWNRVVEFEINIVRKFLF